MSVNPKKGKNIIDPCKSCCLSNYKLIQLIHVWHGQYFLNAKKVTFKISMIREFQIAVLYIAPELETYSTVLLKLIR
jgi:hypothetical protein